MYGLYALVQTNGDVLFKTLAERKLSGTAVRLTNGLVVGRVTDVATPFAIGALGHSAGLPDDGETAAIGVLWKSADMLPLAREAQLVLDPGRGVFLVGDTPEPTRKSLHTGWGQRLVAGETIRFA
jgi:hypothetical protein